MSVHTNLGKQDKSGLTDARSATFMASYLDVLTLVERLHRLLLDVIKDEFERVGILEINVCAVCVPLISWILCICDLGEKSTIEIDGECTWQMVVMDLLVDARLSNHGVAVTDVGRMM
jgi:hypothetical protein